MTEKFAEVNGAVVAANDASALSVQSAYAIDTQIGEIEQSTQADQRAAEISSKAAQAQLRTVMDGVRDAMGNAITKLRGVADGGVAQTKIESGKALSGLESPIKLMLEAAVKTITNSFDRTKVVQDSALADLDQQLSWVEQQLKMYSGGHKGLQALEKTGEAQIESGYKTLLEQKTQRDVVKSSMEGLTSLTVQNVLLEVDTAIGEFKKTVRDHIRERDRLMFE